MATTTSFDKLDPNQLRQAKTKMLDRAKALQTKIDAGSMSQTDEEETNQLIESLIGGAEAYSERANAIEAREKRAMPANGNGRGIDWGLQGEPDFPGMRRPRHEGNEHWRPMPRHTAADLTSLDDGGFRGWADYLGAIRDAKAGQRYDKRLESSLDYQAAGGQTRGSDPHGGFLVPDVLAAQLVMDRDELQPWLRMRNEIVWVGSGDTMRTPILDDRDRSDSDIAGLKLSRLSETSTLRDNVVRFKASDLKLSKAGGLAFLSNELLEDSSIDTERIIRNVFARALAMLQATDYLSGNGVGEPLGILNASMLYTQAIEDQQDDETIVGENLVNMRARCRDYDASVWLTHPTTYAQLVQAHISGTNSDRWLFTPSNGTDVPATLLGRPIHQTETAHLLGSVGDIILTVPRSYTYIARPTRLDASPHVRFDTDELGFKFISRDDGRPLVTEGHTDQRGFETSEHVVLAEREE
ncbi:MAG: phage major capsid protein [Phycisphaeraceae bacterium]